jgi:pilus assembly protein CpaC
MSSLNFSNRKRYSASVLSTRVAICLVALVPNCIAQQNVAAAPIAPLVVATVGGTANTVSRVGTGGETLHLVVGHSLFLNTRSRLRRVYVTDPAMLSSMTLSPSQIVVTAMTAGVSSLVLLDEDNQAQSYVVSSDVDVSDLRTAMSEAMRDDVVHVEGNGSRITLSGNVSSDALSATAVKLAGLYTKDVANSLNIVPAHVKQVRLKVRILEVDRSKVTQFGVNLFNPAGNYAGAATTSQFPTTATVTNQGGQNSLTVSDPLNYLFYDWKYNIGATVKDLENKQVLQILAEPTITAISGQKANFLAGGEFPFPVIQPGGAAGTSSVTIQFRPYGVKLEFTPEVHDDGTILLKVAPEVSALDYTNAVTISGYTIPAIATRRAETSVELRSDQSFAISGLLDKRTTDAYSRTPGVSSIPIIGQLFKSKNINHANTELIVIVTPTIVDPLTDSTAPGTPQFPVKTMDNGKFDKGLASSKQSEQSLEVVDPTAPAAQAASPTAEPATAAPASVVVPPVIPAVPLAPAPAVVTAAAPASPAAPAQVLMPLGDLTAPAPAAMADPAAPATPVPSPTTIYVPIPAVSTPDPTPAPLAAPAPAPPAAPASTASPQRTPAPVAAPAYAAAPVAPPAPSRPAVPVVSTLPATAPTRVAAAPATTPKPGAAAANIPPAPRPAAAVVTATAPAVSSTRPLEPIPRTPDLALGAVAWPYVAAPPRPAATVVVAVAVPVSSSLLLATLPPPAALAPSAMAWPYAAEPVATPAPVQLAKASAPTAAPAAIAGSHAMLPFRATTMYPVQVVAAVRPPVATQAAPADLAVSSMVQVMALTHHEDADMMVTALKRRGYDVSVSQEPQDSLLHLQVGPFASTSDAEGICEKLKLEGYNATIVSRTLNASR